jgi:hypothetical protein
MNEFIPITKNEDCEQPVPSAWRELFWNIVESLRRGDFLLKEVTRGVEPLDGAEARRIAGNINAYGSSLTSLPDETWQTSICRWQGCYWEVLIDLFTVEEGESDLVLFSKVFEDNENNPPYRFEIDSVNVP